MTPVLQGVLTTMTRTPIEGTITTAAHRNHLVLPRAGVVVWRQAEDYGR